MTYVRLKGEISRYRNRPVVYGKLRLLKWIKQEIGCRHL